VHGGSAQQVMAAAKRRLLQEADPAAARLAEIALSPDTQPKDAIVAICEILDRAGINGEPNADVSSPSQVLWDEFIQIHRRRFGNAASEVNE
jgi:hypothetical protein